jgi:23S rRNA (pseudouridine1915-N3)-methyltransferase
MYKITIIAVGSLKEEYWQSAIDEYTKRLGHWCRLDIYELSESNKQGLDKIEAESNAILSVLSKHKGSKYLMDISGKQVDSVQFGNMLTINSQTCLVVGGSNGVSDKVSRELVGISFGGITMPHQLFRVVLVEQIYRSSMIAQKRSYHK